MSLSIEEGTHVGAPLRGRLLRKNKSANHGALIAIEGIDGAGTTTQTAAIASWLGRCGLKVRKTAEPSKGPFGRHLRRLLRSGDVSPEQLALLFAADRLDHVEREINPALNDGTWVVTDRYRLSSLAYQALDCEPKWVAAINRYAPPADLTFLIDIPVKLAISRLKSRGTARERFESERTLERVRESYLELADSKREGVIIVVNGSKSVGDVSLAIEDAIRSFYHL